MRKLEDRDDTLESVLSRYIEHSEKEMRDYIDILNFDEVQGQSN